MAHIRSYTADDGCHRWKYRSMVYIPAEMGYGKFSQPGIPGGSTLIFEIELLGIA